jgi:hypothetical protein
MHKFRLVDILQTIKHYLLDSYHGKTPSYRWRNEGIVPGFKTVRIRCRLEGHDRFVGTYRSLILEVHFQELEV